MFPEEFWIVVTERDADQSYVNIGQFPRGPLVHEGYLMTEEQAHERAKLLRGVYGWVAILPVKTKGNL